MIETVEKGHPLQMAWEFPFEDDLDIDTGASSFTIQQGDLVVVTLPVDTGFYVERHTPTVVTIRVSMGTAGLPEGPLEYTVSVLDTGGGEVITDSGTLVVTPATGEPVVTPGETGRRTWDRVFLPIIPVSDKRYNDRIQICLACEFYEQPICMQCGCNQVEKARAAGSACPIAKWGAIG